MNLIQWDIELFELVNSAMSNVIFDTLLPWVREPLFWIPLYIFIIGFVFFNYGRNAYWFVIFFILTVSSYFGEIYQKDKAMVLVLGISGRIGAGLCGSTFSFGYIGWSNTWHHYRENMGIIVFQVLWLYI